MERENDRRRFERAVRTEASHLRGRLNHTRGSSEQPSTGVGRRSNVSADLAHEARRGAHGREDVLTIRTAFEGGTFVIALYGEVDLSNVDEVDQVLLRAEASDATEIVLDLSGLHFIESAGIRLLVVAHARSRADGNRLSLLRGDEAVQHALDICGLADNLPFVG